MQLWSDMRKTWGSLDFGGPDSISSSVTTWFTWFSDSERETGPYACSQKSKAHILHPAQQASCRVVLGGVRGMSWKSQRNHPPTVEQTSSGSWGGLGTNTSKTPGFIGLHRKVELCFLNAVRLLAETTFGGTGFSRDWHGKHLSCSFSIYEPVDLLTLFLSRPPPSLSVCSLDGLREGGATSAHQALCQGLGMIRVLWNEITQVGRKLRKSNCHVPCNTLSTLRLVPVLPWSCSFYKRWKTSWGAWNRGSRAILGRGQLESRGCLNVFLDFRKFQEKDWLESRCICSLVYVESRDTAHNIK